MLSRLFFIFLFSRRYREFNSLLQGGGRSCKSASATAASRVELAPTESLSSLEKCTCRRIECLWPGQEIGLTNFGNWYTLKCMKTESPRKRGIIVGITGGIACGKTTVSDLLAEKGAIPINADEIGHQVLKADSPVINVLTEAFGKDILEDTGDISRKKLGAIVFNDKAARERLNSILHPLIIQRSRARARQLVSEDPQCIVLLDAPLLIEAGAYDTVDLIVVVTASAETQLKRTLERSKAQGRSLTESEVRARIGAQMPLTEKVKYADIVIANDATLAELHRQVDALWEKLQRH